MPEWLDDVARILRVPRLPQTSGSIFSTIAIHFAIDSGSSRHSDSSRPIALMFTSVSYGLSYGRAVVLCGGDCGKVAGGTSYADVGGFGAALEQVADEVPQFVVTIGGDRIAA